MLLKLIKTREMISGAHCEIWEANLIWGDNFLAKVFVLNEHMPLELIYRLTVSWRGICIQGRHCGWQWENEVAERKQKPPLPVTGRRRPCFLQQLVVYGLSADMGHTITPSLRR